MELQREQYQLVRMFMMKDVSSYFGRYDYKGNTCYWIRRDVSTKFGPGTVN
jgi:hypothetical protein